MAGVAACRDARGTASTGWEQALESPDSVRRTPDGGRASPAAASRRPDGEQGQPAKGAVCVYGASMSTAVRPAHVYEAYRWRAWDPENGS